MPPSRVSETHSGSSRLRDTRSPISRPTQSTPVTSDLATGSTRYRFGRPGSERIQSGSASVNPYLEECRTLRIPKLHPMQRFVVDEIASRPDKDQFVIAATGSGKSLLYELPGILKQSHGKITVVFIPRIAIIRQELARLQDCGIAAEGRYQLKSDQAVQQLTDQDELFARAIQNPTLLPKFLLATPHQLEHGETRFQTILSGLCDKGLVQRFVFDEIHMLLNDHKTLIQLPILRQKYPGIPLTILSASLSPLTVERLSAAMRINSHPHLFPLDRPNLYYEILPKYSPGEEKGSDKNTVREKELSQLTPILRLAQQRYPGGSGLVFCRTKKGCDRLALLLREKGVGAQAFNSEQAASEAGIRIFSKWKDNDPTVQILVSTNTLSSGMHKPDVRFVVHASLPTSGMDGYMQETGRAGRDGKDSTCLLLCSFGDAFVVQQRTPYETDNILALLLLAYSTRCRRRSLLSHFGDRHFAWGSLSNRRRCCDVCDGMTSPHPDLDVTSVAVRVLRYCERHSDNLKGRETLSRKLNNFFAQGLKTKKETTHKMWNNLVQWLIIEQYLEVDRPGEKGGGQIKLVKGGRFNNILRGGEERVYLPWALRFDEPNVRGEDDGDCRLRWTEAIVRALDTAPSENTFEQGSPEL